MATNVSSASTAAVMESFARNQNCRERNLDKIVFVTEQTLQGKKIVNAQTEEPVSYQVILDAFRSLSDKTADVQRAIIDDAHISPALENAHQVLQARIASVAENVQKAAEQTGIVQKQDDQITEQTGIVQKQDDQITKQPVSRRPSIKTVAMAGAGLGVLGAAGIAGYMYRDQIAEQGKTIYDRMRIFCSY